MSQEIITTPTFHPSQASLARALAEATGITLALARKRVSRAVKAGEVLEVELRTAVDAAHIIPGFDEALPNAIYQDGYWLDAGLITWLATPDGWIEKQKTEAK